MKSLAELAMRGRAQALGLTVAGVISVVFCWVAAAIIALVTLRKGTAEGAWVLLWALLPAAGLAVYVGDAGPLVLLVGTAALAMVLRESVNLPLAVLASAAVGLVTGLGMLWLATPMLEEVVLVFGEVLETMGQRMAAPDGEPVVLPRPTVLQVAGILGAGNAMTAVACLLLGRYWQAALYNPGGFGSEFRALALPAVAASGLLLAAVALWLLGFEYRTWAMMFLVPLSFVGVALVHDRVRRRGYGRVWLAGFYCLWLLLELVRLGVVLLAVADSFLHFRGRPSAPPDGGPTDGGPTDGGSTKDSHD